MSQSVAVVYIWITLCQAYSCSLLLGYFVSQSVAAVYYWITLCPSLLL